MRRSRRKGQLRRTSSSRSRSTSPTTTASLSEGASATTTPKGSHRNDEPQNSRPGPPSGAWLDHIGGDLSLKTKKGSLIDVEPGGAGRFAGLLSFGALPRRLAFDFRDVFNKGFVFDEITADFVIIDGNAYTDNLKLTGPVADVGMVGRTGLRDHDYRQHAIVTAEPVCSIANLPASRPSPFSTVGALTPSPLPASSINGCSVESRLSSS